jgi:MFS-type transporter involved in bile tolerance (Atg22 family)
VLGAIVDIVGGKKQFLGVALALGALGSLSLAFGQGQVLAGCALVFAIANLGFAGRFLIRDPVP